MKEFKGTKGEWALKYNGVVVCENTSRTIAIIGYPYDRDKNEVRNEGESWLDMYQRTKPIREEAEIEKESNAQLIAAAPDMLEALQETDKDLCVLEGTMFAIEKKDPRAEGMMEMVRKWRKRNQEAINKALGE